MIYRAPGFLAIAVIGSSTAPFPVSNLSLFLSLPVCRWSSLLTDGEGGGEGAASSYDSEKAGSSINQSIRSGQADEPEQKIMYGIFFCIVAYPGCLSRIRIFSIPDSGFRNKKKRRKKRVKNGPTEGGHKFQKIKK